MSLLRLVGLRYGELTTQSLRYSEFDDLRQRLESSFPHARNALPALPRKSVLCMINLRVPPLLPETRLILLDKFRPKFLENRRIGLQYFLK